MVSIDFLISVVGDVKFIKLENVGELWFFKLS